MPLNGKTRIAFLIFFTTHIPITILCDSQAALPSSLISQPAKDVLRWYTATFHDTLMAPTSHDDRTQGSKIWFQSIVTVELLFQLPFFFYAVYALWNSERATTTNPRPVDGKGIFRSLCMIYGSHTSTTLVPILAHIVADPVTNASQTVTLLGFYLPYLIFPFWLMVIAASFEDVFDGNTNVRCQSKGGIKTK
mmetsp:Transcript_19498/g.23910  ORF Transcript_19498/g.23910 Transcript_19498/m.23910 type:complete len:193 (+) Transcript_19498:49-627(+)